MIEALARAEPLETAMHFGLALVRCIGLVVFCPIIGSDILPYRIRFSAALALAIAIVPGATWPADAPAGALAWALMAGRELTVGFALGITARVFFDGVEGAARLVAGQSGFALSQMVDPLTGAQTVTPVIFHNLLATSLFLAADLHHVFIRGLQRSYAVMPPALALPDPVGLQESAALIGTRLFGVAVQLAAPALVVTFAVDLVLVLVGRALPQIPVFMVGYPVKMGAGLVAMAVLATGTGAALGWIGRTFASDGALLMRAFAAS